MRLTYGHDGRGCLEERLVVGGSWRAPRLAEPLHTPVTIIDPTREQEGPSALGPREGETVMRTILPTDQVGTIAGSSPFVVAPWLTLREAASEMASNSVGLLVVLTPRHRMGVVSERDIVGAIADGADVDATRVSEVMTDQVIHVPPEASIAEVAALMERNEVRHVLVVSEEAPVAVLSVRDLLPLVTRSPVGT